MNFKVTFHLDGSGVYYDPNEPLHLDALLAWVLAPKQGVHGCERDEVPELIRLPLLKHHFPDGGFVYHASALVPEGPTAETTQYWRKRFRQNRAELAKGSPNLTNGTWRDWQMPVPLTLCTRLVAYASGDRKDVRRQLREVTHLGKKRAHGHGRIVDITTEEIEEDWSLVRDGVAQRWLPDERGTRLVRLQAPYWHPHNRVRCCEVGDIYELPKK